jgi:hypothetical protein
VPPMAKILRGFLPHDPPREVAPAVPEAAPEAPPAVEATAEPISAPAFKPMGSEVTRRDLARRIGAVPPLRPRAPLDPREFFWWQREHPGANPFGLVGSPTPAIVRLEDYQEPDGRLFDVGIVLITAWIHDELLSPHRRYFRHSPGLLAILDRHARGDLGDRGTLEPSTQAAMVKSRHHCISPGFRSHGGKFRDPQGCDVALATVFGDPSSLDPDIALTVTLACFESEPFARPVSTFDVRRYPTSIVQAYW